jgi:hypothetical protein
VLLEKLPNVAGGAGEPRQKNYLVLGFCDGKRAPASCKTKNPITGNKRMAPANAFSKWQ